MCRQRCTGQAVIARPTQGNGGGDAGNIAGADGRRQGGGECLKMRNLPVVAAAVIATADQADGMTEAADLHQAHTYREIQAGTEQDDQGQRVAPEQSRQAGAPVGEYSHQIHQGLSGLG